MSKESMVMYNASQWAQSDYHKSMEALRESEHRLKTILASIQTGLVIISADTHVIVEVNPAAAKLIGLPQEKIVGQVCHNFICPSQKKQCPITDLKKDVDCSEKVLINSEGEKIPILKTVTFTTMNGGRYLIESFVDITKRKHIEKQIISSSRLKEVLLRYGSIEEKLKAIADGIVDNFDADFCRIWMTRRSDLCNIGCSHAEVTEGPHVCRGRERCLHLVASSGRYTHIDGKHQRVPLGAYKIGHIASGKDSKFVTNNVTKDPRVHNHDWARKLGLVSFAGYRLLSADGGIPVGVLALFKKSPISNEEDALLEDLANTTAHVIHVARAEQALIKSEGKYRALSKELTLGLSEVFDALQEISSGNPDVRVPEDSNIELIAELKQTVNRTAQNLEEIVNLSHEFAIGLAEHFDTLDRVSKGDLAARIYGYSQVELLEALKDITNDMIESVSKNIGERMQAEKERRRLQAQVQRAEKMEAIGTLAGGVAHDLNNILSGLVTYPELLLMDIPNDSPLRDPVLTIQASGKKAAAIVQDLLTLARRGVAVTEVVNFNDIVKEYLRSPEYEKLTSFHQGACVETHLEKDLLNILGSPVHVSKTIMNLISNAAEAIGDKGKITISTNNQYVDRPVKGYDEVKEGDYVVLRVSDNGTGISPEDLQRIFEPFYTKKVMGRSGTGLGMAVVWGTVKDHHGYIDVESEEGKGTTFTLYFPVTRKAMGKNQALLSVAKYMGSGEKILVIDDVKEQRELASAILTKLGYKVDVAESGEDAVVYLEENAADLLILDMIMEPGMDGLDTYKKILERHPGQKAIIASGYSETDRVKEAQKLGAGKYVKKPYSLEKIGLALKEELEK